MSLNLVIITGSHRPKGESGRIGRVIEQQIKAEGHKTYLLDLSQSPGTDLPFWDEGMWGVEDLKDKWAKLWTPIADQLKAADGFIVVSPEYHGMVSSRLKNLMLLTSRNEVGHKPGLIVTVSGSLGGSYPVAELRAHTTKNNRLVWVPDHVIIRGAPKYFKDDVAPEDQKIQADLQGRLTLGLEQLYAYAEAMKPLRSNAKLSPKAFAFAM
jgi:NAD(P)H-dependent FMN reductase